MDYKKYSEELETIIAAINLPEHTRILVDALVKQAKERSESINPDAPTALDGLSNVQRDNANKSTNYNGYDPTIIARGSETNTDKGFIAMQSGKPA